MPKRAEQQRSLAYREQMRLSLLNLAGELPNLIALAVSALTTRAVIVFVDLIDTASNTLRNLLMAVISKKLGQDLRYAYNYGVGKIEALISVVCDSVLMLSLLFILGFAVRDLFDPRPAMGMVFFAIGVKLINLACDFFMYFKQKKLCERSSSLVFQSAYTVAVKNLIFDLSSFSALLLMTAFADIRFFWYISPVASLVLGGYLIVTVIKRVGTTCNELLDKTTDERTQTAILKALKAHRGEYMAFKEIRSRFTGGNTLVDIELVFDPAKPFSEITAFADVLAAELAVDVPNCRLSLRVAGHAREKTTE